MSNKIYTNSAEVVNAYAHGELTLEECNARLKELGSAPLRDPLEPKITPEMAAKGYCLLDTGTGSLDKVKIRNGKLVNCDCGTMYALVSIAGRTYHVKGTALVE